MSSSRRDILKGIVGAPAFGLLNLFGFKAPETLAEEIDLDSEVWSSDDEESSSSLSRPSCGGW